MTWFDKSGQATATIDQYEVICASGSIGGWRLGTVLKSEPASGRCPWRGSSETRFRSEDCFVPPSTRRGSEKTAFNNKTVKNDYTVASVLMCNYSRLHRADDEPGKCYRRLQISSHVCSQKFLKLISYILAPGLLYRKA